MRATTLRTQGKTNGDSSPTGYALGLGVPGSLVGDRGTAPMTDFNAWARRYRWAIGFLCHRASLRDTLGRPVTLLPARMRL